MFSLIKWKLEDFFKKFIFDVPSKQKYFAWKKNNLLNMWVNETFILKSDYKLTFIPGVK